VISMRSPCPKKEHGVVADHVTAAQGLDADLVGGARPDVAMSLVACALTEITARGLSHGLGQTQSRAEGASRLARWCVSTISTS